MKCIDRNGIVIERCESCGGVFLDKHELDQLIKLENEFIDQQYRAAPAQHAGRQDQARRANQDRRDDTVDDWVDDDLFDNDRFGGDLFDDDTYDGDDRRDRDSRGRRGRKKSFIEELFDSIT